MDKILYYPYINLPKTDWTIRTLLYYDCIGSIIPSKYSYAPKENYEPFMLELVQNELVIPIDPISSLNHPWEVSKPFIHFLEDNHAQLTRKREAFSLGHTGAMHVGKFSGTRMHINKFDSDVYYHLEQMGLAKRKSSDWYIVEKSIADLLMKFLATVISAKLEMRPTTDVIKRTPSLSRTMAHKRETILTDLIPFPEEIDLKKIRKFKDDHLDLLNAFKNRVEQLVLDENLTTGTEQFDLKVEELKLRKEELSAKMNESQIKNIIFGSVFGVIGAYQGLATAETTGAFIGGLPGFASAIHSALKIERAENVFDQSGLKYLALVDKRVRQNIKH